MARQVASIFVLSALALTGCAANEGANQPAFKQIPDITYQEPDGSPAAPVKFKVAGSMPEVVGKVVDALNGPRFGITHVDRQRGVVTAIFRADPDDYLDCGNLIAVSSQGEQLTQPAASRRLRYEVPLENNTRIGTLQRDLSLNGRLVVTVQPSGADISEVRVEGDYILSRSASVAGNAGQTLGRSRQLIAFGSGQAASFGDGDTRCFSNGLLEQKTLTAKLTGQPGESVGEVAPLTTLADATPLPAPDAAAKGGIVFSPSVEPSVTVGSPTAAAPAATAGSSTISEEPAGGDQRGVILNTLQGGPRTEIVREEIAKMPCAHTNVIEEDDDRVRISGLISSQTDLDQLKSSIRGRDPEDKVDFQLVVTSPTSCEMLTGVLPLQRRNGSVGLGGASIGIAGGAATLAEGDPVVFDVAAPNFESYLYVMYLQQDGGLVHLLPNRYDPDRLYDANQSFTIGDDPTRPSFTVSPPYGDDLLILIASSQPLFDGLRPQREDGGAFAIEFAELIEAVEAAGGDLVADLVFLNTRPRSS